MTLDILAPFRQDWFDGYANRQNPTMLKIGIASAGKNAEGSRRMLRMLRVARMPTLRLVLIAPPIERRVVGAPAWS